MKQLKQQLKHITKGSQSVSEYMRNILTKTDQLALLGAAYEHENLLDIITDGLGEDYYVITEMANGRDVPISVEELLEKLLNRENAIATIKETTDASMPITANAAQYSHHQTPRPNSNYRGSGSPARGNYRNAKPYLGKCQICGMQGHSARRCPQFIQVMPSSSHGRGVPQWYQQPQQTPHQPWTPQAHYTTASPSEATQSWLLDSGASHHIASDLHNLSLYALYQGNDDVMVGNGTGLNITHTGSYTLPSNSRPLSLTNVLCVPQMKKNLISVNKLCRTNNVKEQLCPFTFKVRDLRTGETLLKGKANDGVYEWPVTFLIQAFPCIKSSLSTWHSRLGHPSLSISNQIISAFSLPASSISSFLFCNSCSIIKATNFHFPIHLFVLLVLLMLYSQMSGLLLAIQLMGSSII